MKKERPDRWSSMVAAFFQPTRFTKLNDWMFLYVGRSRSAIADFEVDPKRGVGGTYVFPFGPACVLLPPPPHQLVAHPRDGPSRAVGHTHLSTDHTFPARPSPGANPISISAQLSPSAIRCVTAKPLSCSEHAREGDMTGMHQPLSSSITAINSRLRLSPRDWRSRGRAWVRRPLLARSVEGLHMLGHPNSIACPPTRWYKAALKPSPQGFPGCGQSVLLLSQVGEPAFSLLSLTQSQPWAKACVFHVPMTLFTL